MTTKEIANRLAELCRQGEFETAQKELFAEDVVSIEPFASSGFEKETHGLQAIIEKGHKFEEMVQEMHSTHVSEPLVTNNTIAFKFDMDITMKGATPPQKIRPPVESEGRGDRFLTITTAVSTNNSAISAPCRIAAL